MSDYHILKAADDGNSVQVAFHISIPVETNLAGKNISTCIFEDTGYDKTSQIPGLSSVEQDKLTAGTLVEHVMNCRIHKAYTNAVKRAGLDAKYTFMIPVIQGNFRQRYWGWGFSRDIP